MRRTSVLTTLLAAGVPVLTGCGPDDDGSTGVVAPDGSKIAATAAPAAGDGY